MTKTVEQLQAALERELEYSKGLNAKIDRLRNQLKNSIPKAEHEKILMQMQQKYELELYLPKIKQFFESEEEQIEVALWKQRQAEKDAKTA